MAEASASEKTSRTKGRMPYRLVSADQHVNEPPDLWTSRVAKKWHSRVPRMESLEKGDAWIIEGVKDPINFGMNACAGLPKEEMMPWQRWERVRKGGYIGAERLKELDEDDVDAALLFPTPRLSMGVLTNRDRDLHLAMVQAYNDWLAEYVSCAPDRLFGMILLPACGVREAIAELKRCLKMPGMQAPTISCYPHGTATLEKEDDALWGAIVDAGLPLTIHVTLNDKPPTLHATRIFGVSRNADPQLRMQELMFGGVLDRFPDLKVVFTEVDAGWVPYFKEQTDNRYHRQARATRAELTMPPSEYFDRHFRFVFVSDVHAIENRATIGVENLLWSDDFPHLGGDWPNTQRGLVQIFANVPKVERELILAGNATRLYRLPGLRA